MRRRGAALGIFLVFGAGLDAAAAELGFPASALKEFGREGRPSFEAAPPLDLEPSRGAAAPEPAPKFDEYPANCFVKIEGRVLLSGRCQILRENEKSVTFELADKPLVISLRHGRVWTATLGDRALGNVYKRGPCWGSRGFYACDRGRADAR